jgi:cytochrome c
MKRLAILFGVITALAINVSAQTKPAGAKKPAAKPVAAKTKTAAPDPKAVEEGKTLISKSDCLACHKVDMKVVGPAYNDVAKKYPYSAANVSTLTTKIINGGSGNWGAVPMTPHPTLAAADATKMVTYILSLNAK